MRKPSLVILAAGMATRYGSMKQMEGFGPSGETIMDYSIYDAIRSGFGKIVFVIRKDFAEDFRNIFDPKLNDRIAVEYVFQELDQFIDGFEIPEGRIKPWGTAHAVMCAVYAVEGPFAVINADDFYGRHAFEQASLFLQSRCDSCRYAIVGYDLSETLSDYGAVNRGICQLDNNGTLLGITERINIFKKDDRIVCDDGLEPEELTLDTKVSMNFWCFDVSYFGYTQKIFNQFLRENGKELKSEFFIPIVADQFIKDGGKIEVLPTTSTWFGVTYKEDAPFVSQNIQQLIRQGEYPENLWL